MKFVEKRAVRRQAEIDAANGESGTYRPDVVIRRILPGHQPFDPEQNGRALLQKASMEQTAAEREFALARERRAAYFSPWLVGILAFVLFFVEFAASVWVAQQLGYDGFQRLLVGLGLTSSAVYLTHELYTRLHRRKGNGYRTQS